MANQLVRKSAIYLVGNAASKLVTAAVIPIYAYWVSPDSLGWFDFIQTVSSVMTPVAFIAVWEGVIRYGLDRTALPTDAVLATAARVATLASALALGVGYLLAYLFPSSATVIVGSVTLASVTGLAQVWQYCARVKGLHRPYIFSGISAAVTNLTLIIVLVCVLKLELLGLLVSYAAGQVAIVLILEPLLRLWRRDARRNASMAVAKVLLAFSAPLVLNLVSGFLLSGYGRILITARLGADANGPYAFALKLAAPVLAVGGVVSMATIEETVIRIGSPSLAHFLGTLIRGLWQATLGIALASLPLIRAFYVALHGTGYEESFPMVPCFLLYAVLSIMATNYGNAFQATLRMRYLPLTTLVGLAVAVVTATFLVEPWGVQGVAVSLPLGIGVSTALRAYWAHRFVAFRGSRRPAALLVVFVLTAGVTSLADLEKPAIAAFALWPALTITGVAGLWLGYQALRDLRRIPDLAGTSVA